MLIRPFFLPQWDLGAFGHAIEGDRMKIDKRESTDDEKALAFAARWLETVPVGTIRHAEWIDSRADVAMVATAYWGRHGRTVKIQPIAVGA